MKRLISADIGGALSIWVLALAASGGPAASQTPGASATPALATPQQGDRDRQDLPLEGTVVNPDWDAKPTGDDLAHLYPPLAQIMQLQGLATITCDVTASGALEACKVVAESPAGAGFGYATILASADFHMKPETLDGKPVRSSVTVPLKWALPPAMTNASTTFATIVGSAPTPSKLAAARQIVAATSGAEPERAAIGDYVQKTVTASERNGAPAPSPDQQDAALKMIDAGLDAAMQRWSEARARRLAQGLSQSDLEAAAHFFSSPAGRAYASEERNNAKASQADGAVLYQLTMANARAAFCRRQACPQDVVTPRADAPSAVAATPSAATASR